MSKPGYKSVSLPQDVYDDIQAAITAYNERHGATLSMAQILRIVLKYYAEHGINAKTTKG